MNITHEEFQRAIRISKAIQAHLEDINKDGLRSTDLYPILARKKLIEKDKSNGIHFRRFLRKLKDNDLLKLIPQCKFQYDKNPNFLQWHFYRVKEMSGNFSKLETTPSKKIITPIISEDEINDLINQAKPHVEKLPKKDESDFTLPQLETKELYKRAYETWTTREIEIMERAYAKFGRIDKVAELLERQPSVIKNRLKL
jgi:hypothetical protein